MQPEEFKIGDKIINDDAYSSSERGIVQTIINVNDGRVVTNLTNFALRSTYAFECKLISTPDNQNLFESYYTL